MRPSIKYPTVLMPRPTRTSLARQLKIRNSISISSIINTEQIKSENDLRTIGLTKRTSIIIKNPNLFKQRRSFNRLAAIISSSSLDNSTSDGETLEQVIVASLTEHVRKLDLIESNNKENYSSISKKISIH
ncbi:unnamed protein product [Rotaria sp. Silwood2]|nr:unnamed protein product [Rotaria sp. Silwood2]CAF4652100.1 unnamed protein product [Rotaria sp. Silwood2]CAF4850235.1 unnamed protein product [Rotaria sp. Silwood2]